MKKFCALSLTLIFVLGLAVSPVFAAGGKEQGYEGQGEVEQGEAGAGASPGYNAQDNMVD